jgi:predicted MFS family arabinose efflux permease
VPLVFAAFAAAYFMSYAMRSVNAVLGQDLSTELSLGPQALGLLTAAYLLMFAAMQLPLGVLLDKYGARRVETVLLLVAAIGCGVFAMADSVGILFLGRALIGAGVSACLMGALTSYRLWYPAALQGRLTSWMLVAGISGSLTATMPVRFLADQTSWRMVFAVSAVLFIICAIGLWFTLPKALPEKVSGSAKKISLLQVFKRQALFATIPAAFVGQGGFLALQTLWAGPWMVQVLGIAADRAAFYLLVMNLVLLLSYLLLGVMAPRMDLAKQRRFILTALLTMSLTLVIAAIWREPAAWILWPLLAICSTGTMILQSRVSVSMPREIAGRGNTAYNFVQFSGAFVIQWAFGAVAQLALSRGFATGTALGAGLATLALLQWLAAVWMWRHWRAGKDFDAD